MAGLQPLPQASRRIQVIGSTPMTANHTPPAAGTNSDALFGFTLKWDLYERVLKTVTDSLPGFAAGVTVTVKGGPNADIRRVWYLALSAALGRYRNRVRGKTNTIEFAAIWDVTGKACQVEIAYTTNNIEQFAANLVSGAIEDVVDTLTSGLEKFTKALRLVGMGLELEETVGYHAYGASAASFIQRGPEQLTVGGPLPRWLRNSSNTLPPVSKDTNAWVGHRCYSGTSATDGKPFKVWLSAPGRTYRATDIWREFPNSFVLNRGIFSNVALAATYPYSVDAVLGPTSTDGVTPVEAPKRPYVSIAKGGDIVLPDDGRVITTGEKGDPRVQSPTPPVDGVSRGSLLNLVAQSLQNPCFLPTAPPCTLQRTHAGTGVYAYPAGTQSDTLDNADDVKILVDAINKHGSIIRTDPKIRPAGPVLHPDGYALDAADPGVTVNVKGKGF